MLEDQSTQQQFLSVRKFNYHCMSGLSAVSIYIYIICLSVIASSMLAGMSFMSVSSATYDIQEASVSVRGGEITVTADLITGSLARGLFIVFVSGEGSPDEFRSVLREGEGVNRTIPAPPPSTYSLLLYDLEDNTLPNTMPALQPEQQMLVETGSYKCSYNV